MSASDELGPVDYVVVEFPGDNLTGEGLSLLVDLVDRGIIRILDLVVVRKGADGSVMQMVLSDGAGGAFAAFRDAASGLLSGEDVHEAAQALQPGTAGAILLYENRWAAPFVAAMRRANAGVVATGRIPYEAVLAAIEAD